MWGVWFVARGGGSGQRQGWVRDATGRRFRQWQTRGEAARFAVALQVAMNRDSPNVHFDYEPKRMDRPSADLRSV